MTAPNAAVGALPGWRGTDPDGGTWVRLERRGSWRWLQIGTDYRPRTQEEAEAAGLVRLIPAVGYHYDERGEDVVPDDAAPAPLDPGNPEHLRQVADFVRRHYRDRGLNMHSDYADNVPSRFEHAATCIEREAAKKAREAEQDAADRKRAEEYAERKYPESANHESYVDLAYDVIRAERARQEAGQ